MTKKRRLYHKPFVFLGSIPVEAERIVVQCIVRGEISVEPVSRTDDRERTSVRGGVGRLKVLNRLRAPGVDIGKRGCITGHAKVKPQNLINEAEMQTRNLSAHARRPDPERPSSLPNYHRLVTTQAAVFVTA
jgi:hypothetical protein